MDQTSLANEIATQVVRDTNFWVAIVGFVGALLGAGFTILGNWLLHRWQNSKQEKLDAARQKLLGVVLTAHDWRKLSTLSRVIGCDAETTRRLLIELNARGSETPRTDGEEMWGLISKHPLEKVE